MQMVAVTMSPYCPEYAPFFGFLGAALALVFGNMGAAYGTWKSALGLATISKLPRHKVQTEMVMKAIMPVILSGVCGIFGLIIAVIISSGMAAPSPTRTTYSLYTGYAHLGAGMTVGLSNLASGLAIGMCGSCGVQDSARQPKLYIGMVLIWSFGSALGLYGLIVALIIAVKVSKTPLPCPCTAPTRLVAGLDQRTNAPATGCAGAVRLLRGARRWAGLQQ